MKEWKIEIVRRGLIRKKNAKIVSFVLKFFTLTSIETFDGSKDARVFKNITYTASSDKQHVENEENMLRINQTQREREKDEE